MLKKGIKKLLSVSLLEILRLKLNMRLLLKLLKLRKLGLYIIVNKITKALIAMIRLKNVAESRVLLKKLIIMKLIKVTLCR